MRSPRGALQIRSAALGMTKGARQLFLSMREWLGGLSPPATHRAKHPLAGVEGNPPRPPGAWGKPSRLSFVTPSAAERICSAPRGLLIFPRNASLRRSIGRLLTLSGLNKQKQVGLPSTAVQPAPNRRFVNSRKPNLDKTDFLSSLRDLSCDYL